MKKLCIAGGLIAVLLVSICSTSALAGDKRNLAALEPAAIGDFDFVVLAKSSSTTVTADIAFPLAFEFIPVIVVGDGTGAFSSSMSRTNTTGEIIYLYQRFPGAGVAAIQHRDNAGNDTGEFSSDAGAGMGNGLYNNRDSVFSRDAAV